MDWQPVTEQMGARFGLFAMRRLSSERDQRALRRVAADLGWDWPYRGVVSAPGRVDDHWRLAAVLEWVGGRVALTGWSALWVWGLTQNLPTRVHVLVDHSRRNRRATKYRVSRTRHFDLAEVHLQQGLATVSAAWALTDMAVLVDKATLRGLIIDARQRRLITLDELALLVQMRGGFPGRRVLMALIEELDEEQADSTLEYLIRRRIEDEPNLPAPAPEPVEVELLTGRVVHVDIGWVPQLVGLECLGRGAHSTRTQLERDAVRDNGLEETQWTVFRATWRHVTDDDAWYTLVGQLRRALARAGGRVQNGREVAGTAPTERG